MDLIARPGEPGTPPGNNSCTDARQQQRPDGIDRQRNQWVAEQGAQYGDAEAGDSREYRQAPDDVLAKTFVDEIRRRGRERVELGRDEQYEHQHPPARSDELRPDREREKGEWKCERRGEIFEEKLRIEDLAILATVERGHAQVEAADTEVRGPHRRAGDQSEGFAVDQPRQYDHPRNAESEQAVLPRAGPEGASNGELRNRRRGGERHHLNGDCWRRADRCIVAFPRASAD